MQHRTHAGDREVELQVTIVVPGQGAHPVAGGDAQLSKGVRQLGNPASELGVGVAVAAALPPGHDLLPREQGGGPPEEVLERQGQVGHRTAHRRRSEEHTSELQSQSNLVCRLLLEKKKIKRTKYLSA